MFLINLDTTDPFFNLAIEEFLLKNSDEEYLILGVNSPCVIIGKHQSAHREVNTRYVLENKIPVIRRISGGGTVFHDNGNLNFTFIRQSKTGKQVDFPKYTQPVIDFLFFLGITAKFEGKSDLKVDGFKISGNAEHIHRNRVLHHGTLLYCTSLEMLRNSLRKDTSCYHTRAVASNPSPVLNLNEKLKEFKEMYEFRAEMVNYFFKYLPEIMPYNLTLSEKKEAELISDSKYKTWEWNWAYGPEYTFRNTFVINGFIHSCTLFIKDGVICKCTIEGSEQMKFVSKELIGCRHMVSDLSEVFQKENIFLNEKEIYNFF
jgi:lipoate-protein ligase A